MTRRHAPLAALALLAATVSAGAGCGDTGQQRTDYPLRVVGNARAANFDAFGWRVEVDRAELSFGPLYLCASEGASAELCATAQAEMLSAARVDLLAPREREVGRVVGVSGAVGSAMYDFGITWTTTQQRPTALSQAVGGHSLQIEGRASSAGASFGFRADVDLLPPSRGFRAVQGRRLGAENGVDASALVVGFDVAAWLSQINWDALQALGEDPVLITPDSKAANALIVAISASAPPSFRFSGGTP